MFPAKSKMKFVAIHFQSVFIQLVEKRLVDDTIRSRMKPLLQNEKVADETLIRKMGFAISIEIERTNKFTKANNRMQKVQSASKTSMPV